MEIAYRVLLGGGAACSELQREVFELRLVIQLLLGHSHGCGLWYFRRALCLRPFAGLQRCPMVHGCRGLCRLALH